jgi:hypothetical protein
MDIAVNLVENYLRLSGYMTLSEFEVQRRNDAGEFETATDIDIMALRLPGSTNAGNPDEGRECQLLLVRDPVLQLEEDLADVIVGEVKQGEAEFNPGIRHHEVLHPLLRRLQWLYDEPLDGVVQDLGDRGLHLSPARGGGRVRSRLVAFGRSAECNLNTISITHVVDTLLGFFSGLERALRPAQFRDPAPALLNLLLKTGFDVQKHRP